MSAGGGSANRSEQVAGVSPGECWELATRGLFPRFVESQTHSHEITREIAATVRPVGTQAPARLLPRSVLVEAKGVASRN